MVAPRLITAVACSIIAASAAPAQNNALPQMPTERLLDAIDRLPSLTVEAHASYADAERGVICPESASMFTITPGHVRVFFPREPAAMGFSATAVPSRPNRSVSWLFATPTCRVTVTIEKQLQDSSGAWTLLAPAD
jgi:hypothetical protein